MRRPSSRRGALGASLTGRSVGRVCASGALCASETVEGTFRGRRAFLETNADTQSSTVIRAVAAAAAKVDTGAYPKTDSTAATTIAACSDTDTDTDTDADTGADTDANAGSDRDTSARLEVPAVAGRNARSGTALIAAGHVTVLVRLPAPADRAQRAVEAIFRTESPLVE